ncbi:MAG: magnesium-translocating P-type ATPase [Oscillospiraceae bacterium]|jgi:Mg2+-importing ATPase|nr:magnesium-translocating P-type ATPase [Oscillospiraceae bacterium]
MKLSKKETRMIEERKFAAEVELRRFALCKEEELFAQLESGRRGLSAEAAEEKLDDVGPNVIVAERQIGTFGRLLRSVVTPFNLVLALIIVISFVTDVLLPRAQGGAADYSTCIIIFVMILVSSLVAFVQAERSNAAAEKLTDMISNKADIYRDGAIVELPIDEIVPGDVVKLSAGDMIPGDVRFLAAKDAFIAQAALTGESAPVEKFAAVSEWGNEALTDLSNLGFMGTNVVSGTAEAVVLATGNDTYFGSMAKTISGDRAKNSFERGVDSVSRLLLGFMAIMVPIIFAVNGIAKNDWWDSLLFAVAVAVGLTPEMLPVIMTSTLAKGAVVMSRHKVIVKNLSAIQTFGEMDILCTDKTGTLTEDKIVLERYIDVHGNDDARILRHAYFNSYFQTGLKNLLDLAIINRAKENGMEDLLGKYNREDEIPFDFTRRRMSVVLVDTTGKRQLITKGAAEEMMAICKYVEYGGQILPLEGELLAEARRVCDENNREGLRVLAVAQKNNVAGVDVFSVADESEMVLIGFVGFLDPPKESAKVAIAALKAHGVRTVVLTGDSEGVAVKVCKKVDIAAERCLTGKDVEAMDDEALAEAARGCDLFAKLSPSQKQRLVETFQKAGHTVGYMGDGINDAPALRQADVGISVDSGVDIAKETADLILLEKDLMVLERGVEQGRKTFGNIIKYIKMTASSNFGNMFSVLAASAFLPFIPMLSVQLILLNLIYDLSCVSLPWDNVDREYIASPRKWDAGSIRKFMLWVGPTSSVFDITTYLMMFFVICPLFVGRWAGLDSAGRESFMALFQTGWFVESMWTQTLVIHLLRTPKLPFIQSRASGSVTILTALGIAVLTLIPFLPFAGMLGLAPLPPVYFLMLGATLVAYMAMVTLVKRFYVRKVGEWL